eukprot:2043309-Pyramimonas_sp.AAC.1
MAACLPVHIVHPPYSCRYRVPGKPNGQPTGQPGTNRQNVKRAPARVLKDLDKRKGRASKRRMCVQCCPTLLGTAASSTRRAPA